MARLPLIETARLQITPFTADHLSDRYVAWLNDPQVVKFSEQRHRKHDIESCRAYWQSFAHSADFFSAIMCREDNLGHIGNVFVSVDRPNGTADIAILIGERSAWGRGYATEAWRAIVGELLDHQGMRKITGGCMAENSAMRRVMEASGMTHDYQRTAQFLLDGAPVDSVHYAKFAGAKAHTLSKGNP
jgi:ribosomal-protein-alanine N-acetyltransferase